MGARGRAALAAQAQVVAWEARRARKQRGPGRFACWAENNVQFESVFLFSFSSNYLFPIKWINGLKKIEK